MQVPFGFEDWSDWAQGLFLAGVSLISEDFAVTTGSALALSGTVAWWTAFLGCFLGIWLGDAALFLLARFLGRPLIKDPRFQKWIPTEKVERAERWFQRRGLMTLVISRFVPGSRLPTFVAAGLLGVGVTAFMTITGVCALVWCMAVFWLMQQFGEQLVHALGGWENGAWALLALIVVGYLAVHFGPVFADKEARKRIFRRGLRWTRWEFWPPWLFYLLPFLNYMRLSLRYGTLTAPTAANPGMPYGGFVGESKFQTLKSIESHTPEYALPTLLLDPKDQTLAVKLIEDGLEDGRLIFPFVLKPDVGQRGVGVRFVKNWDDVRDYLSRATWITLAQRRSRGDREIGALYYRFPDEAQGRIFSITDKRFPSVTGDGQRTLGALIETDPRARYVADTYLERFHDRVDDILPDGVVFPLAQSGNHAQGCVFYDGARLLTPELEARIDDISRRIPGFFFGRFDLRYEDEEALRLGNDFEIIELNGAGAESTNIYDPSFGLLKAYGILLKQWSILFKIGDSNRRRGASLTSPGSVIKHWWRGVRQAGQFPISD